MGQKQPGDQWHNVVIRFLTSRLAALLLACLTFPLLCWGCGMLLSGSLPIPQTDFLVVNRTGEELYITPVDMTPGRPVVIEQPLAFTQRDIPLQPGSSIRLKYYGEIQTLSGIVICRGNMDCRLAAESQSAYMEGSQGKIILPVQVFTIGAFSGFPAAEADLLSAVRSHRRFSFDVALYIAGILLPVALFARWLYLLLRSRSGRRKIICQNGN